MSPGKGKQVFIRWTCTRTNKLNFGRISVVSFDRKIAIKCSTRRLCRHWNFLKATTACNDSIQNERCHTLTHTPSIQTMNEAFRFGKRDHRLLMRWLCLRKILSAIFISNHFYPLWHGFHWYCFWNVWDDLWAVFPYCFCPAVADVGKTHKVKPENDVRSMSLIWIFCHAISKCMAFANGAPWMACSKKGTHQFLILLFHLLPNEREETRLTWWATEYQALELFYLLST